MENYEFTTIEKSINLDSFINNEQDTISSRQLNKLIEKSLVEVYTEDNIRKFQKDAFEEISKSENSDELKKSAIDQLSSLQKHRVDGKIIFLRVKQSEPKVEESVGEGAENK